MIILWTDGSVQYPEKRRGRLGVGGWAFHYDLGERRIQGAGSTPDTTAQAMELTAVIRGLESLRDNGLVGKRIKVTTDCMNIKVGVELIERWKSRNWVSRVGTPILDVELWLELERLMKLFKLRWQHVNRNLHVIDNSRVDEVSRLEAMNLKRISRQHSSTSPFACLSTLLG